MHEFAYLSMSALRTKPELLLLPPASIVSGIIT